jgi:Kef-type K+ transport system membrane component KefB/voltage-gated potassium channel Kch
VEGIYFEITVIITLAAFLTLAFRFFKLPSILAYILTGIIIGPFKLVPIVNYEDLRVLGQVGITLLLFLLGLELQFRELRSLGRVAVLAGSLQVALTTALGFMIAMLIGFPSLSAFYVGIALAFSSTIIVVKLLSDKKDLTSIHGKLAIGILLMQDFFAVLTIIFLAGAKPEEAFSIMLPQLSYLLLKVILLFGSIIVVGKYVFPKIVRSFSSHSESLFLFSLAWVFLFSSFVKSSFIGFSIEIGGFLAGLALANTPENFQIVARMKSLRDFFITIFFVMLGLEMSFANVSAILLPVLLLSLFVICVKPVIVMLITGLLGYRKRTSFLTGITLSQISEFSLIILFLGRQQGILSSEVVSIGIIVGLVTFATSSYLIMHVNAIYNRFVSQLDFLELRKGKIQNVISLEISKMHKHVIVVGAHQLGLSVIHALDNAKEQLVVIDFNPDVISKLKQMGIPHVFGDVADPEILERAGVQRARLVISTIPDFEDNLICIKSVKHANKTAKVIVMALETMDARALYAQGADYVVLPHLAGGRHLAKIIVDEKHLELIEAYKERDLAAL